MYGKIEDGVLVYASKNIVLDGATVCNPTDEQMKQAGFRTVVLSEKPTDEKMGQTYVETWEDDGTFVTQKWIIQEVDLDVLKELKTTEISTMCAETIGKGVDVELSVGTKHFSLTDRDQMNLFGKKDQLKSDLEKDKFEYHSDGEPCVYYSREDMTKIVEAAFAFVSYHTTYCNSVFDWIRKLESANDIRAITYGVYIPEEYQSEVMVDYYKAVTQ